MELRFIAFALTLLLLIPGSVLSEEATRQSRVRAVQHAAELQQASQSARQCQESAVGAAAKISIGAVDELARPKPAEEVPDHC